MIEQTASAPKPRRDAQRRRPAILLGAASIIAMSAGGFSGSAQAQSAPPAGQPPAPAAQPQELQEVIVNARQRSENLQKTPFSIVAVTAEKLTALGVVTTMDLDNKVPGLELRPDNNRLEPFVGIRGVGDISRNPGIDNRTGLYLDGAPLGRSSSVNYPIYDVDSVEILRGPQGTLFGNNSLTGVIAIQSQKPTLDDTSRMTVDAGSRNLFSGSGYVNAKITDDLALRVTLAGRTQDGYYKNIYNNSTIGGGTDFAGRVQLRWTPTADTIVDISADAVSAKDDIMLGVGQFTTGPEVGLPNYQVDENFAPTRDRQIYGFALNVQQKLPHGFTLTSISSYRTSKDRITYDGDGSPLDVETVQFGYTDWDISQEVRIASPVEKYYDYVVGVFYYHQNPGETENVGLGSDYPVAAARGLAISGGGTVAEDQEAVYAHGAVHPTPWLTIDGGLRYQNTTKAAYKVQADTAVLLGYPALTDHLALGESSLNPMASVTVTPVRNINVYALYSTGDRAGGFNMDVVKTLSDLEFKSESVVNYEVGIKSQLFGNRLRLNVAAYTERFKNFQQAQNIIDPNPAPGTLPTVINVITNAARVKSEGVEADFDANVYPGLRLTGGVGFNHAYYESFPDGGGPGVSYTGNDLIEAPRFQGSITLDYRRELTSQFDGHASINYTYRSDVFSQPANKVPFNDDRYLEGRYGDVGARVGVVNRSGNFEIAVFAKNLFDEVHTDGAAPDAAGYLIRELNEPRTIGVELTLRR